MSEEELIDLTSQKTIPMAPKKTHSDDAAVPYFFVRTKDGSKEIKLLPKVEVVVTESRC